MALAVARAASRWRHASLRTSAREWECIGHGGRWGERERRAGWGRDAGLNARRDAHATTDRDESGEHNFVPGHVKMHLRCDEVIVIEWELRFRERRFRTVSSGKPLRFCGIVDRRPGDTFRQVDLLRDAGS